MVHDMPPIATCSTHEPWRYITRILFALQLERPNEEDAAIYFHAVDNEEVTDDALCNVQFHRVRTNKYLHRALNGSKKSDD